MKIVYHGKTPVLNTAGMRIVEWQGYYHYISHKDKIITYGLDSKTNLKKYNNSFLATDRAIEIMKDRYIKYTNK